MTSLWSALTTAVGIGLAFAFAAVIIWFARRAVNRSVAKLETAAEHHEIAKTRGRQALGALKLLAFGMAAVASISFAAAAVGFTVPHWTPREIADWVLTHGVRVAAIVAASYITMRAANLAIEHVRFRSRRDHTQSEVEWQRRAATLTAILSNVVTVVVGMTAGVMVLRELSVDVVPILTGAGIAGLAVGFGAQNLVRDVISGFFFLLEDQVRVGDTVRLQNVVGTVEQLNLRTMVVRDGDGAVNIFPNGTITSVANLSKGYSTGNVDIMVPLRDDLELALRTMRDVAAELQTDPAYASILTAPIDVLGIESMTDRLATIRATIRTSPLQHHAVAREFRRRLALALASRGIRSFSRAVSGAES